jgi:hypothetical protein
MNRLIVNAFITSLTGSALLSLSGINSAQAVNLLQNGSFENTAGTFINSGPFGYQSLNPGSTVIPGWTTTTAELAWGKNGNVDGIATPYESFFVELAGNHNYFPYGGVTQTINTTVDQQYTLSLSLGTFNPTAPGPISVTATAGSTSQTFTSNPSGTGNQWNNFSFDFTATSTSTPISIVGISTANIYYIGLDNASVEAKQTKTVPEPSNILGLGLLGLGLAATKVKGVLSKKAKSPTDNPQEPDS